MGRFRMNFDNKCLYEHMYKNAQLKDTETYKIKCKN